MIDRNHRLALTKQAALLGISRGSVYYEPVPVSATDLALMRQLDELHIEFPFASARSGTSIDRLTRISKIGNAVLRAALYMPAMSAMRYNPAIVALMTRLKSRGRLKPKQIVVAAMRKLLVLCFGVLKTGKPFDPALAMGC